MRKFLTLGFGRTRRVAIRREFCEATFEGAQPGSALIGSTLVACLIDHRAESGDRFLGAVLEGGGCDAVCASEPRHARNGARPRFIALKRVRALVWCPFVPESSEERMLALFDLGDGVVDRRRKNEFAFLFAQHSQLGAKPHVDRVVLNDAPRDRVDRANECRANFVRLLHVPELEKTYLETLAELGRGLHREGGRDDFARAHAARERISQSRGEGVGFAGSRRRGDDGEGHE